MFIVPKLCFVLQMLHDKEVQCPFNYGAIMLMENITWSCLCNLPLLNSHALLAILMTNNYSSGVCSSC